MTILPDNVHKGDHGHTQTHSLGTEMHRPDLTDIDELHSVQEEVIRNFNEEEECDTGPESVHVVVSDKVLDIGVDASHDSQVDHASEDADC
jgi:hypothetical protein